VKLTNCKSHPILYSCFEASYAPLRTDIVGLHRFLKKVNLRKFDKYITEVQLRADEIHGEQTTA
jgi:hypothetical protein